MRTQLAMGVWALLYLSGLPAAVAAQAEPQRGAVVAHWDPATLDSLAAGLASGDTIAAELSPRVEFVHLLLRRTTAGEAELHDSEVDLVQVRSGRARLTTGGGLEGQQREAGRGEWRAASIRGGATRVVGPGDILVIPARTPHLWEPIGEEPFLYVIIKVPARR